jgi:hypothetical protein
MNYGACGLKEQKVTLRGQNLVKILKILEIKLLGE